MPRTFGPQALAGKQAALDALAPELRRKVAATDTAAFLWGFVSP